MFRVLKWALRSAITPPRVATDPSTAVQAITNGDLIIFGENVVLTHKNGMKIGGTLWHHKDIDKPTSILIFVHSLGTNRYEALHLVSFLVTRELSLFSFDLPACGMSEGNYLPLDGSGSAVISSIVDFLRTHYQTEHFAIWGRSLGASIALQSAAFDGIFDCVVSDSAFSKTEEIIDFQGRLNGFPTFLVDIAKSMAIKKARNEIGIDLTSEFPLHDVVTARTPLFMGHGKDDIFINPEQALELFDAYGCTDKQLMIFDGRHNSARPHLWYENAAHFLYKKMGLKNPKRGYAIALMNSLMHVGSPEVVRERVLNPKPEIEDDEPTLS